MPRINRLHLSTKPDSAVKPKPIVYPRKIHGSNPLPVRPAKQKFCVSPIPADDEDMQKFQNRTSSDSALRDYATVQVAASEDARLVDVVDKSVNSSFMYDGTLQTAVEVRCQKPSKLTLQLPSTQLLKLPDDLPQVCHRVPHKQLLVEMTALIKQHLSRVVL